MSNSIPDPIQNQFDIWLLWSVGHYANGFPMITLRGVYSTEEAAKRGAEIVMSFKKGCEKDNRGIVYTEYTNIEKRQANHTYAASMIELNHL